MKKILIILLALALVFSLASCRVEEETPAPTPDNSDNNNNNNNNNDDNTVPALDIEAYKNAVANTSLVSANIKVTASNDYFPNDPLVAEYDVEFKDDGSAVVNFTYMQYNTITPGGTQDITSTYNGYANIAADGTVTGSPISTNVTAAASVNFNLDLNKMTASDDHGILYANIPAANTASVLGGAIGADVVLTLIVSDGVVTGATISYVENGVSYEIVCTYN